MKLFAKACYVASPPEHVERMDGRWLVCPRCGGMCWLGEELYREYRREQGKLLFSQERTYPWGLFPVHLQALFDVCLDCGSPYAVALVKSKGVPQLGGDGPRPRLQRPR